MRFHTILTSFIVFCLIVQTCQKEDVTIDLELNNWKVEEVKWSGQSNSVKTDSLYIIEFHSDSSLNLQLDVNTCFGKYFIQNIGEIEIRGMGCTEMCCDSEFAESLPSLFLKMTRYYGKGERLYLEGEGEIVLEKY